MYEKKYKKWKKSLEKTSFIRYTKKAVTLIAVKREVAARKWQVFRGANVKLGNWRQVTVSRIEFVRRTEGWRVGSAGFFVGVSP